MPDWTLAEWRHFNRHLGRSNQPDAPKLNCDDARYKRARRRMTRQSRRMNRG